MAFQHRPTINTGEASDDDGDGRYGPNSSVCEMNDLPPRAPSDAAYPMGLAKDRASFQSEPPKQPPGPYGNSILDINWHRPSDYNTRKWFFPMWVCLIICFGLAVGFGSAFFVTKHHLNSANQGSHSATITMTVTTTLMHQTSTQILLPTTTSSTTPPTSASSAPQAFCSYAKVVDRPHASAPEAAYAIWTNFITDNGTELLKHVQSSCSAKGNHLESFQAKAVPRNWTTDNNNGTLVENSVIWTSNMRFTFSLPDVQFNETVSSDLQCVPEGILAAGGPPDPNLNHCQGGDDVAYRPGKSPFDDPPDGTPAIRPTPSAAAPSVAQASCFAQRKTTDLVGPVDVKIWTNYIEDNGANLESVLSPKCETLGFGNWTASKSSDNCTATDGTIWESNQMFGFRLDEVSEQHPESLHCVQQGILEAGGPNNTAFCSYQVPASA